MTSHGHGVARPTRPRTEEQRQVDLDKISRYRSLEDQVRERIAHQDYGRDTFDLTAKLLQLNPEYYTIWNARRRCLISGLLSRPSDGSSPSKVSPNSLATATPITSSDASLPSSSTETPPVQDCPTTGKNGTIPEAGSGQGGGSCSWEDDLKVIKSELGFTVPLLIQFPKCYWIWNYRLWTLDQAIQRLPVAEARKIWEEELGLVGKMLDKDTRNFHAWGYRRYVVEKLESPDLDGSSLVEPEFQYTTRKIGGDLSNFSAWHHRSQLIPRLLREREATDDYRRQFLEDELTLIRNGLNVGPEDQSLWFYHQYLVSNIVESGHHTIVPHLTDDERKSYIQTEIDEVKDLLEDYTDVKWIYEALIQYTLALSHIRQTRPEATKPDHLAPWLRKLRELDPQRSGRWADLERELGVA